MLSILVFIGVLLVIVLVHEWGHFFTARKTGMRVEEFGFGIPPRLFSWKGKETVFSINALPIGGFVRIAGENGLETNIPKEEQMESKPWWAQALVLVAGVVCNVLLGYVLFFGAYLSGVPIIDEAGTPTILSVNPDSPAENAGLQMGDQILTITLGGKTPLSFDTDGLHAFLQTETKPITLVYERKGEAHTVEITPEETEKNGRIIGVTIERVRMSTFSIPDALRYAFQQTTALLGLIFTSVAHLIGGLFSHPSAEGVMGPVGLVKTLGSASASGIGYLLGLTAALSLNLAVINILPFPALDGGRLLIVLLEAITRRKFSKKVVSLIHAAGFIFLLGVMVLLTIHDIRG